MSNTTIVSSASFSPEQKEVLDSFQSHIEALIKKDKEAIEEYLDPEFVLIHKDGKSKNKNEEDLLKKFKLKSEKRDMKSIFPNSKLLNMKNWGKDIFDDWEQINYKEESKTPSKITNTSITNVYIPQIVIKNNIIGIDYEYMQFKPEEKNKEENFIDIIESEERIQDSITINKFLYGLDIQSSKNDILLSIEDVFGRNIGNKSFYLDFCDKIIKARGEKKTLYEIKIFSNLVFLTNESYSR